MLAEPPAACPRPNCGNGTLVRRAWACDDKSENPAEDSALDLADQGPGDCNTHTHTQAAVSARIPRRTAARSHICCNNRSYIARMVSGGRLRPDAVQVLSLAVTTFCRLAIPNIPHPRRRKDARDYAETKQSGAAIRACSRASSRCSALGRDGPEKSIIAVGESAGGDHVTNPQVIRPCHTDIEV